MTIKYEVNKKITTADFIDLLKRSKLAERRPIHDIDIMKSMVNKADLIVCALSENSIIGIARCMTDFVYCCYVSELAVDSSYQKQGVGKNLIKHIQNNIKDSCSIILLAAPNAVNYYPKIGFSKHNSAFVLRSNSI